MKDKQSADIRTKCTTFDMTKYALGACAESLILNSFFGFSMLYYTKSLGLSPSLAGIATFIATWWDGITDPIMGHISDNTKSRFGKRYPYILTGGVLMVFCYFFIWYIPAPFKTNFTVLFWYLVVLNLLLRTTYTVFSVPYSALGFEICNDYNGRSKLQGIKSGLNMAANFAGPAMAWMLFFPNNEGGIKDTQIAQNYINMGTIFTVFAFIFLLLMLCFNVKYIKDSRCDVNCSGSIRLFFVSMKDIVLDRHVRSVFLFMFFVLLGYVLVSTLQMFVFDDFMKLSGLQKTIAHGGTMVGMGLGSVLLVFFVRIFDKKGAIYIAVSLSVFSEFILAGLFLTGFMKCDQVWRGFPIAFVLFVFFHGVFWFGCGILLPTATSMIADVSEINKLEKGVNKDASYAAMFSLAIKISMGVSALVSGYCLKWTGFVSGADAVQTHESIWRVCALTFIAGPLMSLAALSLIIRYPVNKKYIDNLRMK